MSEDKRNKLLTIIVYCALAIGVILTIAMFLEP